MATADRDQYRARRSVDVTCSLLDAAADADERAVKLALGSGADVNVQDAAGRTSVTCAIAGNNWGSVDASHASFKMQQRLETLRLLLGHAHISLYALNAPVRGVSPLCLAAWLDIPEVVRMLLDNSHGMVSVNGTDAYGATPLMYAARDGRTDIVRDLLAHDAHPDHRDANHRSAIQHALRHPHVLWLCEHALRVHRLREYKSENGRKLSPLPQPHHDQQVSLCKLRPGDISLQSERVRKNAEKTETLIQAIAAADLPRLHCLLFPPVLCTGAMLSEIPALVNLPDSTGWSPIHYCVSAERPSIDVLDTLYYAGADVCLYTSSGHETPLHCLAHRARPARSADQATALRSFILHLIRDLRAPLSAGDHNMDTCIHIAAEHGKSIDVLEAFLACDSNGTVRDMRNSKGLTALEVAKPEFRIAFGLATENARSISSASVRTVRPSTSTSIRSMPPLTRRNSALLLSQSPSERPSQDSSEVNIDVTLLPQRILNNLRKLSLDLADADAVDVAACRDILQETADMRVQLMSRLRSRVHDAAEDLRDVRRTFQHAHSLYHELKRSQPDASARQVDRTGTESDAQGTPDYEDTDSSTAVSVDSFILISRKCRSMTDLRIKKDRKNEEKRSRAATVPTVPPLPTTAGVENVFEQHGSRCQATSFDSIHRRRHTDASEPQDRGLQRRRSHDSKLNLSLSGSKRKEVVANRASRLKAWVLKKFLHEHSPKPIPIAVAAVKRSNPDEKASRRSDSSSESESDSTEKFPSCRPVLACQRGLIAVNQDLHRIEGCLDAAEQMIGNVSRSVSQAETKLDQAIKSRKATLECVRQHQARSQSEDAPSRSPLEWSDVDCSDSPILPAGTDPAGKRSRTQSVSSSVVSFSSTLIEGEDEETRALRRLLTRKLVVRMDDAEEEIDKTIIWLRIVKEVLRGLWNRTHVQH
ncbi:hypothetical protein WOLCODRAFT_101870 [Wolfiporia cocos MD-104 SS10]|uniref:Uncharacterized protein n=1 Tax=Wolfiporia cocos (strain MD-104) TaxID=742152 RepID=A0A2H3JJC2_WOLCO|nr:hypothetical protein WOLCODRAFT_101870 [Wolfiporia cocos MD-104 SS10]